MIEKKDILAMVRHVTRHSRGVRDPQIVHPMREWITGVGVVLIGVAVGGLYSFVVYNRTLSDQSEQPLAPIVAVPYQAAIVEQALTEYGARRVQYDLIIGAIPNAAPIDVPTNNEEVGTTTAPELPTIPVENEEIVPVPVVDESAVVTPAL